MGEANSQASRRAQFRERRPGHYCPQCTMVLYPADDHCPECEAHRPEDGWPALADSTERWLGRVLDDRYLLTRRIGHGSSGAVYRADALDISRRFAVKIISLDGAGPTKVDLERIQARLNREIDAMGRLRNPHVVSFYDVLSLDDRSVALLMDLIEGHTLEVFVDHMGGLPAQRACSILRQIANGVHEAHEAGMIHRDLKPENIMIERLPAGDDFVHVLDFGIVWREGDAHVTQGFLGTPLYASPEQAVGGDLDRRADIYALGGILFYMLTGRPPFPDDNVYRVLKAHVSTQPPRLSEVAPQRNFPEELEELTAKMLAKNPGDRPQTLAEVIETLDELKSRWSQSESSSRSSELPLDPINDTGGARDLHATVESEASAESLEQAAAKGEERGGGFFESAEWDTTGPKAAILRGRTPAPASNLSEASAAAASAELDNFANRSERRRRQSGLFPIVSDGQSVDKAVMMLAGTPDGHLALANEDQKVLVGDPAQGFDCEFDLSPCAPLASMCLSEQWLATGHRDGTLWYWSLTDKSGAKIHQNASDSPITSLGSGLSGHWLAIGTRAGGVYLAEMTDRFGTQPLRIHSGPPVEAVAISDKSNLFAVGRDDGSISVFDLSSPTSRLNRLEVEGELSTLAFSNDGYLLAVVFADQRLALYQALNGQLVMRNDDMLTQPLSAQFDRDDQLIGFCHSDQTLYKWDLHHNLVEQPH